ncbi:peptide-N4-(N-acetyl-beta-glucosaminyl)asparagine amidase A-like [Ananas comosus]|uniref:Peptide-N4-(N-acetyl-beta- glucosaminyl)asparagine amidase A-like n=1 Tax=Ananas comosus TaxID=4615 RepID=A0A6P5FZ73_ANACO|nr:peptide-N4-(N-acetyl-beta-glucosaminyl)asparagine amidase A-like [Ananas comosus]
MHLTLPYFSPPPFLLLFLFTSTLTYTHHVVQCGAAAAPATAGVEFLDPTLPPVLPTQPPRCSVLALYRNFAAADPATANFSAFTSLVATAVNYTQPEDCPAPWTRVILELSVSVSAGQKDHTGAVWIAGVEVLRTRSPLSTATPAFWTIHKDITRYSAAIRALGDNGGAITVAIEKESNRTTLISGVFAANLSLHFYRGPVSSTHQYFNGRPGVKGLYREPADMIIPISRASTSTSTDADGEDDDDEPLDSCRRALWFRIDDETDTPTSTITVPPNTYRAVLEIFASYHGDEESWYANPLQSSYGAGRHHRKLNGGLRQVFATIDGKFAGGRIPFPVIYPGSVNPYYWSPVAAIGAFDMPSYDVELTPLLGLLLEAPGPHEIGVGVNGAESYWLVTGNLHVWVDRWSDKVAAMLEEYRAPPLRVTRQAEWGSPDGSSGGSARRAGTSPPPCGRRSASRARSRCRTAAPSSRSRSCTRSGWRSSSTRPTRSSAEFKSSPRRLSRYKRRG